MLFFNNYKLFSKTVVLPTNTLQDYDCLLIMQYFLVHNVINQLLS